MKSLGISFLLIGVLFAISGCAVDKDVSNAIGKQIVGKVFIVCKPLVLYKFSPNNPREVPKLATLEMTGLDLDESEIRRSDPTKRQVAGLVKVGDRVTVTRMEYHDSPVIGPYLNTYGKVVSGEQNGKTVSLNMVVNESKLYNGEFDSSFLKMLSDH